MGKRATGVLTGLMLAVLVAGGATAQPATPDDAALTVMSFNVRTPADTEPGRRWQDRRQAMVAVIDEVRPDVIGTQELVKEQADYLVEHLAGYRWFGEGRRGGDGDEHMGVFYDARKVVLEESGNFWLSDTPGIAGSISWGHPYPRMVTWGVFRRIADGQRFRLLNTHLPYRSEDEAARVKGAGAIVKHLDVLDDGLPVVLTGDFNSEPGSPTYKALESLLKDARKLAAQTGGPRLTFHDFSGTPTRELDWILVRGFEVRRFETVDRRIGGVLPSDHFPLVVKLAPAR